MDNGTENRQESRMDNRKRLEELYDHIFAEGKETLARGGVVDEDALKAALESGKVTSAGLDVIEDEKTFQSVLRGMPQVVITPHTAYSSFEAEQDCRIINMENILDVLEDKRLPRNSLNPQVEETARFRREA